jgi:hypothetical protein
MATIPSTIKEFNTDLSKFMIIMGDTSYTQEQVSLAFRAVTLRYLGLRDVSAAELEDCAMVLTIATNGARQRGWTL